jgi:hypothetical protein
VQNQKPITKYIAEWRNYRLFVEWIDDHWEAAVFDTTAKQWGFKETVLSPEEGQHTALEVALRAPTKGVSPEEAEEARRTITLAAYCYPARRPRFRPRRAAVGHSDVGAGMAGTSLALPTWP